jgi:DNA (cytosine-5)-methyltransferase 1
MTVNGPLILSIFPGLDLLGRAFEEEWPEACIVRGPDLLWGGDIKRFHPPAGKFDGVIGGPPCQFASIGNRGPNRIITAENLTPELERCVAAAEPEWFLMENVPPAPLPEVAGYIVKDILLQNRWLGQAQQRQRRFSFGTHDGRELHVQLAALESIEREYAVLATEHKGQTHPGAKGRKRYLKGRPLSRRCELQGLPADFADRLPFTDKWRGIVIGNGVPLAMGRAIANAVKRALAPRP